MRNKLLTSLFTLVIVVVFCSIAAASLQDGLIVYYPFDEANGQTAADSSGNANNATLTGSASWEATDGKIGGALALDGSGSTAEDTNGANYINGLTAFSISVWVKSASIDSDRGIIHGIDPDGSDNIFTLRYDAKGWAGGGTNVVKAGINTTSGQQQYESASEVQTTEWQHLALTWSSGNLLALYIDGELDEPTDNTEATEGGITDVEKFLIGKGAKDNESRSWEGLIDEIHLYDRVLEDGEIADLASGLNVTPVEARGKLATLWGSLKH